MSATRTYFSQEKVDQAVQALVRIGGTFYAKNWSLATSSNYSVVINRDPLYLLMTASGKDKGRLTPADFVVVNQFGAIECGATDDVDLSRAKPSAEVLIHTVLAKNPEVGAILHTHSIWSTILSGKHLSKGHLSIEGYEMLKAFNGVTTHEHSMNVTIFPNTQEIESLARTLAQIPDIGPGFLIEKHGLYATGANIDEAQRHIEAFEFLFEAEARTGV